jgi:phosphatidylglycerophosphatase A
MNTLICFIATGFGSGYLPKAPGTFGSAAGMLLLLIMPHMSAAGMAVLVIALIGISVFVSGRAERLMSSHDDPRIVIDEIAGIAVTMLFMPLTPLTIIAGFLLFRLFDVKKPFIIRSSQKLPGGWGITVDDVLAGIASNICLQIFYRSSTLLLSNV